MDADPTAAATHADPAAAAATPPEASARDDAPARCRLPTRWGTFDLHGLRDAATGDEHAMLTIGGLGEPGDPAAAEPPLVRVHSECLTGDTLFSLRCDCGPQLERGLRAIAEAGRGALVYLRQEGRGIGLVNKIRAYALQEAGADTVEANRLLGLPDDARDYAAAARLLRSVGVARVRLMTNNPAKVRALEALGIEVVERVPLRTASTAHNRGYLATKRRRMGHWSPSDDAADAEPAPPHRSG